MINKCITQIATILVNLLSDSFKGGGKLFLESSSVLGLGPPEVAPYMTGSGTFG